MTFKEATLLKMCGVTESAFLGVRLCREVWVTSTYELNIANKLEQEGYLKRSAVWNGYKEGVSVRSIGFTLTDKGARVVDTYEALNRDELRLSYLVDYGRF